VVVDGLLRLLVTNFYQDFLGILNLNRDREILPAAVAESF
jgi:hypothetical protein